ncbi:MAG: acetamidase/formamidase family protein [Mycobacteriales bacterium]
MHIGRDKAHHVWDNSLPPVAMIRPGDEITVAVANSSGGQITRSSSPEALAGLDFSRVNPVTGPLAVEGARPGDALVVDVLAIDVDDWAWTASIPGFGLLAEDFPDPHLRISTVTAAGAELLPGLRIPLCPMVGTIGVAPPEAGQHAVLPPRRWGGNMDIRYVGPGSRLWLPVGVDDALLSLGDTHAAQGDGEVCGTGIEVSSTVTLRVGLERDRGLRFPLVETDPASRRAGRALVATGIGPDLFAAARDSCRSFIDELVRRTGLAPVDAYLVASVAADLHICEIVDAPNWVVGLQVETALLQALGGL